MVDIMTSRQRLEAALRHTEPDRTPVFEYVLCSPLADHLLGRPYVADARNWQAAVEETGCERAVRQNAVDRMDLAELLGHDMIYAWPLEPVGGSDTGRAYSVDQLTHADPVDAVRSRIAHAESDGGPDDDRLAIYPALREEMRVRDLDLPILAPAYAHGVWTDVDLMQTMLLAPDVAHEYFRLQTVRCLALVERYLSFEMDMIGVGGDFAGNRPLISPEAYREFIVPEVRRVVRRIHDAGCWAVNASDGNLWPVIDDFLLGCEVDGYLEIDFRAGMDLHRLKRLYGDRITFFGNLDCGWILSFGSPKEVRRHAADCLEAGMGSGGHILCASNAITESIPLENYLAVYAAYRQVFGLPAPR